MNQVKRKCSNCSSVSHYTKSCPDIDLIVVCGDSHAQVWEALRQKYTKAVAVVSKHPGSSAQGLAKEGSRLDARLKIEKMLFSLNTRPNRRKWVFLMFGGVDLDFVLYFKKAKGIDAYDQLHLSVEGIRSLVLEILYMGFDKARIVLLGVHPPALGSVQLRDRLGRDGIDIESVPSISERTDIARAFNYKLEELSQQLGCKCIEILSRIVDPSDNSVYYRYLRQGPYDVHLETNAIAPIYQDALKECGISFTTADICKSSENGYQSDKV